MHGRTSTHSAALVAGLLVLPMASSGEVALPRIFSDGMVLQRGKETPIFGTAKPGEKVTVRFEQQTVSGVAAPDGTWKVSLRNLRAGGPHELVVAGASNSVRFKDVLVGEVWIASGQSNMEWAANWFGQRKPNLGQTELPNVRMIRIDRTVATTPQWDGNYVGWVPANEKDAYEFSMVGFLFARELHQKLGVPVGLIQTAWGGTPAESWASPESLKANPATRMIAERYEDTLRNLPQILEQYRQRVAEWTRNALLPDTGNVGEQKGWHEHGFDDINWRVIHLPAWFEAGRTPYDGATWVRKSFTLPDGHEGDLTLELGTIDDFDVAYVNGQVVGKTDSTTENAAAHFRRYRVPSYVLKPGRNVIAVRVFDNLGQGGFGGPAEVIRLVSASGQTTPLSGAWKVEIEREVGLRPEADPNRRPQPPIGGQNPWTPSGLYHAMVCPIAPYGAKGVIWYQGESNADRSVQYRSLFPAMIESWRTLWSKPDLKFYFVQLANFMAPQTGPEESGWAELRDAQTATLSLPHTGMALAIDAGEANDIHPIRKDVVAERLARIALANTYGQRVPYRGPMFARAETRGAELVVRFRDARGLRTNGGAPASFQIAGADRKWVMADAKIVGETIVVSHPQVPQPVAVRYAWANNPNANVYNRDGLPMVPFRSDDWPMSTAGRG